MKNLTTTQKEQVIDFLLKTSLDIDFNYFLTNEDFDSADDIESILENNSALNVEIIYYSEAMKYLSQNDASLRESLELAHEYGYTSDKLNSEILASIHATNELQNDWYEIKDKLQDFIFELQAETEETEEV